MSDDPNARPKDLARPRAFSILGARAEASALDPGLYVVATPIGNLGDITVRAIKTLAAADAVLAEDTRVSRRLLDAYRIDTPLVAFHEHNAEAATARALGRLEGGRPLALISDAGTPLISDPGDLLVKAALAAGHRVFAVPGPSAAIAALSVAGLPSGRFLFEGFLPPRTSARRARLNALVRVDATLVFYEAPHRLAESLEDMAAELGAREAAICRELTKLHETLLRGPLADLARTARDGDAPKGEIVILVGPPAEGDAAAPDAVDQAIRAALADLSVKDAAASVAARFGMPRRDVYARALALAGARIVSAERDADERRRANRFGLRGEWVAGWLLRAKGYRLLARRFSVPQGEVDFVAMRGELVAFVEVKARADLDAAYYAIDETKRRRIERAARFWLRSNPWAVRCNLRADAIYLAPGRLPRHVEAAYSLRLD